MPTKHVIIAGDDGTLYRVHAEDGRVEQVGEDDPDHEAAQHIVRQGKPMGVIGEADASGKKKAHAIAYMNEQYMTRAYFTHVVNLGAKSSDD